jgi:GH43 family beta-xylosidase
MNRRRTDHFAYRHSDALAAEHAAVEDIRHKLERYDRLEALRAKALDDLRNAIATQAAVATDK